MPTRGLTSGELQILDFVFSDTIDFEQHEITTNDKNIGGADNSVTYSDTPHYSHQIWCADFSDPNADTWVFVHEFGHVWQYYYGGHANTPARASGAAVPCRLDSQVTVASLSPPTPPDVPLTRAFGGPS